ncbi:glycoside hydrolase family 3 N-terminal domain-containing protein [Enterovirga rhinocerotis]|uniref:Beta-D-glucoside glucohydrolase n=1 Tax=Enterovirga rhinocerotis TaxID=1339210 RepID=A0A4R7C882_9HYPH|nr:glycoside hydrolase family 3 N-terminal domain-containing protein [Enterovirga rhinocerotis]TDR94648.1 beta-glucosidase [Enterovirga rhinocerotis]
MLAALLGALLALSPSSESLARDGARPLSDPRVEARVDAILSRMTLEEKIGQLDLVPNGPDLDPADIRAGRIGAVSGFNTSRSIAAVQEAARSSRHGVPLLVGLDVVHGFRTIFPLGLAEAASFEPALGREAAEIAAREAAAVGINWTFAPMADLTRDVRWGRGIEGFGEDVLLGRLFTRARVEGYRAGGLGVSLKHFAGYGAAVGGRDYDAAEISRPTLHDHYLPPFQAGIEAGAESVMSAFHTLNGMPATASRPLLTDTLRGRFGFRGFVVSDWQAIPQLMQHGIAADEAEAARKAIEAGTDMDMAGGLYRAHLAPLVKSGRLPEPVVTEAARRVLRAKVAMGLLDRPAPASLSDEVPAPSAAARAAARRITADTLVLLRNEGQLPIGTSPIRKLAVIGGMAASGQALIGPHGALARWEDSVTVLDALGERGKRAGIEVAFAAGCEVECTDGAGFDAAEAEARGSDLVVAVLGEPEEITGEGGSRAHLTLPGRQAELLRRLVETGKPVVVVLLAARPIDLGPLHDRLAGLLMAWFPGTEGGHAVADILFGDTGPSAKLPVSWPRTVGQAPLYYDRLPTGRPFEPGNRYTLRYADEELTPLYPFGFGLTYARFSLSPISVETPKVARAGELVVKVGIENVGTLAGREVVQLYLRQPVASLSRPVRQLKAFEKVTLKPGESRVVTLRVPAADLGFHREDGTYVVEPGRFEIFAGTSSDAALSARFELE